jgi:hypothetical protein
MRSTNYNEEAYFTCDGNLIKQLDGYCDELESRMNNSRFLVSDMLNHKKSIFQNCWSDLVFNAPIGKQEKKNEIMGLYAFATKKGDKLDWKYIGISRTMMMRFSHHTKSNHKSSATWAYQLAKKYVEKEELSKAIQIHIKKYQEEIIHPCYFTFIQIDDNMLLHIAEVYAVNKFQAEWNSFKTH